jgi:hypothetical protein
MLTSFATPDYHLMRARPRDDELIETLVGQVSSVV